MKRPPLLLRILILFASIAMVIAFIAYAVRTRSPQFVAPEQKAVSTDTDRPNDSASPSTPADADAMSVESPENPVRSNEMIYSSKSLRVFSADDAPPIGSDTESAVDAPAAEAPATGEDTKSKSRDDFFVGSKSAIFISPEDVPAPADDAASAEPESKAPQQAVD